MIKQKSNGQFSVKLELPFWSLLSKAIQCRLHFEGSELESYLWCLLTEIAEKLESPKRTISLRASEVLALFDEENMKYLDCPTQILIRNEILPIKDKIFLNKT